MRCLQHDEQTESECRLPNLQGQVSSTTIRSDNDQMLLAVAERYVPKNSCPISPYSQFDVLLGEYAAHAESMTDIHWYRAILEVQAHPVLRLQEKETDPCMMGILTPQG